MKGLNKYANRHNFKLKDNSRIEISFSPNFDNQICKYKKGKPVEGVFLMDCGIVRCMPRIMRYCFEEDVNLRERQFLRRLPSFGEYKIDKVRALQDFQISLRRDAGTIIKVNGNLVIYSFPSYLSGSISFCSEDVPKLVEGILKQLDYEGMPDARIKSVQAVQYYYECLEQGVLTTK